MRHSHAAPGALPFPIFCAGAGGDPFPAFWNPPPEALPVSTSRWANVRSSTFPCYVSFLAVLPLQMDSMNEVRWLRKLLAIEQLSFNEQLGQAVSTASNLSLCI